MREGPAHFEPLAELCVAGDVGIHVDRTFALDEVSAALAHVGEGHALGKVVVTMRDGQVAAFIADHRSRSR